MGMSGIRTPLFMFGAALTALGSTWFGWTLIRPPPYERAGLAEGVAIALARPAWLRAGEAESASLVVSRPALEPSAGVWLVAVELRAGGGLVSPAAEQVVPLRPGDRAELHWSITVTEGDVTPLEASVRLRTPGGGEGVVIWAEAFEVEVRRPFGLGALEARLAGALLALTGAGWLAISLGLRQR